MPESKPVRIMALDLSTTTIGISIMTVEDRKPKLIHHEYFKPPKSKDAPIFERLKVTKEFFVKLFDKWQPDELIIEEFIQFMRKSQAATIIPLAIFNRTIGLLWYERTGKEPNMLHVTQIRHKIKFTKGRELPDKSLIPDIVAKHLGIDFPWNEFKAPEKKPRKTKPKPLKKKPDLKDLVKQKMKLYGVVEEAFDTADGIAVGIAYFLINKMTDFPTL